MEPGIALVPPPIRPQHALDPRHDGVAERAQGELRRARRLAGMGDELTRSVRFMEPSSDTKPTTSRKL